jgi:hypothetical protein
MDSTNSVRFSCGCYDDAVDVADETNLGSQNRMKPRLLSLHSTSTYARGSKVWWSGLCTYLSTRAASERWCGRRESGMDFEL